MVTKKVSAKPEAVGDELDPLDSTDDSRPVVATDDVEAESHPDAHPIAEAEPQDAAHAKAEPQDAAHAKAEPPIDPRGDPASKSPASTAEPQGMIPPYEGRTLVAHEHAGELSATTDGLGQAVDGAKDLDLEHHTKGLGRRPHPGLVPAKGRTAYADGVTTQAGEQSVTTGGLGQAVHGTKDLDLEHHTKGLGRRPHPGLVPAKGRTAYGIEKRGRREGDGRRSLRQRIGLDRLSPKG